MKKGLLFFFAFVRNKVDKERRYMLREDAALGTREQVLNKDV